MDKAKVTIHMLNTSNKNHTTLYSSVTREYSTMRRLRNVVSHKVHA